jgi:16S rRNA (cytosine967-C5)-methyltransferase
MNRQPTARDIALDVLIAVEKQGSYSNLMLNDALKKHALSSRDRGLATELVYGTIQRQNTLDWILNRLIKKGVQSLEAWVRQLLRMGLYQIRYLDKIPSRAAVHETVQIAKQRGHKGISGLVNGVLRNYLRREREWRLPDHPNTVQEMALITSHPEWLVRRLQEVYGVEETFAMLQANNRPPKMALRGNPLKASRDALIKRLREAFPEAKVSPSEAAPQGVVLEGAGNAALHPLYQEGWYTVQDESSMLVGHLLAPKPGERGLDACAAPGGKTTHLAELMQNQGNLLACDIHPHKVKLIRDHAERLGISIIETRQADARELSGNETDAYDFVLLDAPCSGWGVIRRKPDIKWSKEPGEVKQLVQLQRQLLKAVAQLVKPGGVLVYSTCTLEPKENREQVEWFLAKHPEFEWDASFADRLPDGVQRKARVEKGSVQILPHHLDSDGFFISRLRKKS